LSKQYNMVGEVYGKLTVLEKVSSGNRGSRWRCRCECGNEVIAYRADLVTRHKSSCGCLPNWKIKHGYYGTAIYNSYHNMKKRCNDTKSVAYKNYGGRGITYCEKWSVFEGFLDDMLPTYVNGLTLERKDVNGNYCKDNCCWADYLAQGNNKRNNRHIIYEGEDYTVTQLARKLNAEPNLFRHKIQHGCTVEEALHKQELETITYNSEIKTVVEFAKENGMTYHQLKKRLMRGWTVERAITQPLRKSKI